MTAIIWHNPRCSKSRQTLAIAEEIFDDVEIRKYLDDAPTRDELVTVFELLGFDSPRDMMRRGEKIYKELKLKDADDTELLDAMVEHSILIERPIVIFDGRAAMGRPPENIHGLVE